VFVQLLIFVACIGVVWCVGVLSVRCRVVFLSRCLLFCVTQARVIVNVSSREGQFSVYKTAHHPHTNMAKAALNMMTRTAAADFAQQRIYMNAVDPGWVSHENPAHIADLLNESGCTPPLDCIDAAARICEPVFKILIEGRKPYGKLFVNFESSDW